MMCDYSCQQGFIPRSIHSITAHDDHSSFKWIDHLFSGNLQYTQETTKLSVSVIDSFCAIDKKRRRLNQSIDHFKLNASFNSNEVTIATFFPDHLKLQRYPAIIYDLEYFHVQWFKIISIRMKRNAVLINNKNKAIHPFRNSVWMICVRAEKRCCQQRDCEPYQTNLH